MRTLFFSDPQLEAGAALGYGEWGEGSRFHDQEQVLARIADTAAAEQVSLVCCLGDVFDRRRPAPWSIIAFRNFVATLLAEGIRVLIVAGNHDRKNATLPAAIQIFGDEQAVHVSMAPSLYPYDGVVVATLPWTPISGLVAQNSEVDRADLNELAAQTLVESARLLLERCRTEYPESKAVLAGHWAVSGGTLPTGLATDLLAEVVIPLEGLCDVGFDLTMVGHVHSAAVLSSSPAVVSCGSPMVCDWGEAALPHGVWIYDSEGALRFVAIEDRPFVTLDGAADLDRAFGDYTDQTEGAVIRYRYTVTEEEARHIDQAKIRSDLIAAGAHKVFIQQTIVRADRARVAEMTDDLGPAAAFELWLDAHADEFPAGLRAELVAAHSEYVARVEA